MAKNWEVDWILYSFEPPLKLCDGQNSACSGAAHGKQKGICTKCCRYIGRGIWLHAKYCKGVNDDDYDNNKFCR